MKILIIPADPDASMRWETIGKHDLDAMQALVGGLIQPLDLRDEATMWLNEEGKNFGHRYNTRATDLARQWQVLMHPFQDFIAGDAFLTGPTNDEGDSTDLTDRAVIAFCHVMASNMGDEIASAA